MPSPGERHNTARPSMQDDFPVARLVSVRDESLAEVEGYWAALSVGASIVEALAASAWSPGFGITDASA